MTTMSDVEVSSKNGPNCEAVSCIRFCLLIACKPGICCTKQSQADQWDVAVHQDAYWLNCTDVHPHNHFLALHEASFCVEQGV